VGSDGNVGLLKHQKSNAKHGHTIDINTTNPKRPPSLVTSMEMQVLFRKLRHKNAIRRELGIRELHVPTVYKRKVRMTEEHRYNEMLNPYLSTVFEAADWPNQFSARLLLAVKLHQTAVDQLYRDHDITDPRVKKPDMLKLMENFTPSNVVSITPA
jgi:hypothetical protein